MRVHGHVADLTTVPGRAHERSPVDDEAAADADLTRDVQHVMGADRRAAAELREGPEIGVIGDHDGSARLEGGLDHRTDRDTAPPDVRCHRDHPVDSSHEAGHGNTGPHETSRTTRQRKQRVAEIRKFGHDRLSGLVPARAVDPNGVEDRATEPHDRSGHRIDGDLYGEDDRRRRFGPDDQRGTARSPSRARILFDNKPGGDQLADQASDGTPRQAGPKDELRSRQRPVEMELPNDRAEIRPADGPTALPEPRLLDEQRFVFLSLKSMP